MRYGFTWEEWEDRYVPFSCILRRILHRSHTIYHLKMNDVVEVFVSTYWFEKSVHGVFLPVLLHRDLRFGVGHFSVLSQVLCLVNGTLAKLFLLLLFLRQFKSACNWSTWIWFLLHLFSTLLIDTFRRFLRRVTGSSWVRLPRINGNYRGLHPVRDYRGLMMMIADSHRHLNELFTYICLPRQACRNPSVDGEILAGLITRGVDGIQKKVEIG